MVSRTSANCQARLIKLRAPYLKKILEIASSQLFHFRCIIAESTNSAASKCRQSTEPGTLISQQKSDIPSLEFALTERLEYECSHHL